jgi:nucleotide-binding universal stress UspA family protein
MLRQILVPLDGSPLSEKALEYATSIVAPDGEIFLLNVVDMPAHPMSAETPHPVTSIGGFYNPWEPSPQERRTVENLESHMIDNAETYLRRIANRLRTSSLKVDIGVEADLSPAEAIVQTAAALQVDAIVIATHGRSGLSRLLMGSVTQKVVNAHPCPIFVIPVTNDVEN